MKIKFFKIIFHTYIFYFWLIEFIYIINQQPIFTSGSLNRCNSESASSKEQSIGTKYMLKSMISYL